MDDNRFDELIKSKAEGYEVPSDDKGSLSDLHHRMALQSNQSWFVRHRNELMTAASVLLIALFFFWWRHDNYRSEISLLNKEIEHITDQNEDATAQNDHLAQLLARLEQNETDTRVLLKNLSEENSYDKGLIAQLSKELILLRNQVNTIKSQSNDNIMPFSDAQWVYLGRESDLTEEVIQELKKEDGIVRKGEHIFLQVDEGKPNANMPWLVKRLGTSDVYSYPEYVFVYDSITDNDYLIAERRSTKYEVSLKQYKELEKHYQKGVGFKLGPTVESYLGSYSVDDVTRSWGFGLLGQLVLSPSWTVETGVIYHKRQYSADPEQSMDLILPAIDENFGELENTESTSFLLEIPVNLRYRVPINFKTDLVTSAGLSTLLYTKQQIEYSQRLETSPDFFVGVENSRNFKEPSFYFGTANVSLGLQRALNNGKQLEVSAFFKKGLSELGVEQVDADFFGLRSAYWFTFR